MKIAKLLFTISILIIVISSCQKIDLPFLSIRGQVSANSGIEIINNNRPSIYIPEGAISEDTFIEIKNIDSPEIPEELLPIGNVFEISLKSMKLLKPIEIAFPIKSNQVNPENGDLFVAYYDSELGWIALPSWYSAEDEKLHTIVSHLSIFGVFYANLPINPRINSILVTPNIYSGVGANSCFDQPIELIVDANDPNGTVETVEISLKIFNYFTYMESDLLRFTQAIQGASLSIWGGLYGGAAGALPLAETVINLLNIEDPGVISSGWAKMTQNGDNSALFESTITLEDLSTCGNGKLDVDKIINGTGIKKIEILIRVTDNQQRVVESSVSIPVFPQKLPQIILQSPGPSSAFITSSQPMFSWGYKDIGSEATDSQPILYYAKGTSLWDRWWGKKKIQFDNVFVDSFTLPDYERLTEGEYVWGIELTVNGVLVRSPEYRFSVPKYWIDLHVEKNTVVRSPVTPNNDEISWVVKHNGEIILGRVAKDEMILDLPSITGHSLSSGDYEVYLESYYKGQYNRISDIIYLNFEVPIPDVMGKDVDEAQKILKELGFKVNIIEGPSKKEVGTIYKQEPEAGKVTIPFATTINLYNTALQVRWKIEDDNGHLFWIRFLDPKGNAYMDGDVLYTSKKNQGFLFLIVPLVNDHLFAQFFYLEETAVSPTSEKPTDEQIPVITLQLERPEHPVLVQEITAPGNLVRRYFTANWDNFEELTDNSPSLCQKLIEESHQIIIVSYDSTTARVATVDLDRASQSEIHENSTLARSGSNEALAQYCAALTGDVRNSTDYHALDNKKFGYSLIYVEHAISSVIYRRVLDAETDEPLQDVNVSLEGNQVYTLEDGTFYLPYAEGTVVFQKNGYETEHTNTRISIYDDPDDEDVDYDVFLNWKTEEDNTVPSTISSVPLLVADRDYYCRVGPGTYFAAVTIVNTNESHQIIGRSSNGWFLIVVEKPNTSPFSCWLGGGSISGNLNSVKYYEVTPPTSGSGSGQITIVDGTAGWNYNSCYSNYDPNNCYAVYSLNSIGTISCESLKSYGWVDPFTVNGNKLWNLHVLTLFGSSNPVFYDSEARNSCSNVFP